MKKVFFLLAVFVSELSNGQSLSEKLDQLIAAYASQYKFNGTALVAKDGELVLNKGYGWKNADGKFRNDEFTIYQVGSITKQFTSAVILRLQEMNKLSIKDKLSKYFPDYPNSDFITIENLLTHTSGIFNYTNESYFMNHDSGKPISRDKLIELFKGRPLDFPPGTKFRYSNSGYIMLGFIIEQVTGKPYEQIVRELILTPLQMDHSGFDFAHYKGPDKATGYLFLDKELKQPANIVDSTVSYAAGGLYATAWDLYKWDRAIYFDKILTSLSWQKSFTPFKDKYGYGWIIDTLYGKKIIWHNGGIFGFNSHLLRFPNDNVVIILLSNKTTPFLSTIANGLAGVVFNQLYKFPLERKEVKLDESILKQYAGLYELHSTFRVRITVENGGLKAQTTGQPQFDLFAEKEDHFFLKVVDAQVQFIKGADGKVVKLLLSQNNQRISAKKIE